MDYKHLIESTTEYGVEKLKPEDKAYIDGMRSITDKGILDDFLAFQKDNIEAPESIEKMYMDIAQDVIAHLKEYLDHEIAHVQVGMIDCYDEEPENE